LRARLTKRRILLAMLVTVPVAVGLIVSLLVFADSEPVVFTATLYSDVIRFEADGAASLRVTIYDLSENELWSSGQVMGDFVDWDRTNERGERLANGYYIYLAQGWDFEDRLVLSKTGKVVLLPGDQIQLKAAPVMSSLPGGQPGLDGETYYGPQTFQHTGDYTIDGKLGVGTDTPTEEIDLQKTQNNVTRLRIENTSTASNAWADFIVSTGTGNAFAVQKFGSGFTLLTWSGIPLANWARFRSDTGVAGLIFTTGGASPLLFGTSDTERVRITPTGNVGIGTTNATDLLTIQGSSGNLIACYPDSSRAAGAAVFRVESDGDVYADGTVYANDHIGSSSADIAERINTSEWVEAGDVIEIDPDHAGFFRKASGLYSRRVAGIISTSPGVILGNDIDDATGQWDDNRPVLAIAGRVPVKVSTENGPIAIGDLLVSSSIPGVAMKGDPANSIGAVVGKAMEGLQDGVGVIMAQVTLR